jgi:PII-like signaling protein
MDEGDRWKGEPLYAAVLERLVFHQVAGATALPGISGFAGAHRPSMQPDRPVAIVSVDSEEKFSEVMPELEPMIGQRLMVMTDAQVLGTGVLS